jgi:hypothetical protein
MGERPRVTLPAVERALAEARSLAAGNPTVDAARERLGDRIATDPDVGQAVRVERALGVRHLGVVIFRKGESVDVWLGAGRVRRLAGPDTLSTVDAKELTPSLVVISDTAVLFANLHEGQRVCFEAHDGSLGEGMLVEKCRYGALVLTGEGPSAKIMAIGFSNLAPI